MTEAPRTRPPIGPWRRVLGLCPTLVAVLWVAGVARFRGVALAPVEWAALVAMALALHLIVGRTRRPAPMPKLSADTNAPLLAAFAAAAFTAVAAAISALVEWFVDSIEPATTTFTLRVLWHAACCFGACYCTFLLRVLNALDQQARG